MMTKYKSLATYVLGHGVLSWGLPMALFIALVTNDSGLVPSLGRLLWAVGYCAPGGALIGLLLWYLSDEGRTDGESPEQPQGTAPNLGDRQLRVWTALHALVGGAGVAIFGVFAILAGIEGEWLYSAVFAIVFAVPCLMFFLLYCGRIEANESSIRHICGYGTYEIPWDEVREIGKESTAIVLRSETKRLVIPSIKACFGGDKNDLNSFVDAQIERRGIFVKVDPFAPYKFHRGTRLRKRRS